MDHYRRATVSLGIMVPDDRGKTTFHTICSGIIVGFDDTHAALVTAKHCFSDPEKSFYPTQLQMRVPTDRISKTGEDDGTVVALNYEGEVLWQTLPDGSDVAAIPLPYLYSTYSNVHGIGVNNIGGDAQMFQGANVIILGYPSIVSEDYLISPLARGGIISWVNPNGASTNRFLVDANIFQGNSGGPVFATQTGPARNGSIEIGGGYSLIGIVVQDAVERAPVKAEGHDEQFTVTEQGTGKIDKVFAEVLNIGGIGIVEPASKIRLLLSQMYPDAVVRGQPTPAPPALPASTH